MSALQELPVIKMTKVKVQFKAKVTGGFFKFPMIDYRHIVYGKSGKGSVMSYSNSDLFKAMLNRHLKRSLMMPVGLTCHINDLSPDLGIKVEPGFLHTFSFTFED